MSYFRTLLNELQVDGKVVDDNDDFNLGGDEDTGAEDTATSAPADTADNAAENTSDNQQDNAENNGDLGEEEDDFTIDDDDEALDDTEEPADNQENNDAGEEADDDFTIDGGDDTAVNGEDAEGEADQQQLADIKPEKELPNDPTDAVDDDEKRAAEEAIYDSLTDDQKRIRVLQLKIDYKDLYETIITTMEGINDIPKNMENLDTIKRLTMFLTKAKSILIDYMENNFDNNTYLENYTMYIKYLAIFRTTAKVVEELNLAAGKKPVEED